jgi:glucose/mannose-6-phosphate isomerase
MLDDSNVLRQRDPKDALGIAAKEHEQAGFAAQVMQPDRDNRQIGNVVVAGMGGSALAALMVRAWLGPALNVPFEVVRTYNLPGYVGPSTLVIASSYSGNTEETLSGLREARDKGAEVAVIASGGALIEMAEAEGMAHVKLPSGLQPRMGVIYNLRALLALLAHFGVTEKDYLGEVAGLAGWLQEESANWLPGVTVDKNYAKQLALLSVGKTPVFYGGSVMGPLAYKWKISWNENAKNVAFWNEYPEFNHNEFIGWTSHPVEKPFAVFDLASPFEHPQILKRFTVSDKLLSGRRPKATVVELKGETVIASMLWGSVLSDFASIYTAILNGVDPTPVDLIEKLKAELTA